jgi:hypothetical protein
VDKSSVRLVPKDGTHLQLTIGRSGNEYRYNSEGDPAELFIKVHKYIHEISEGAHFTCDCCEHEAAEFECELCECHMRWEFKKDGKVLVSSDRGIGPFVGQLWALFKSDEDLMYACGVTVQ